MPLPPPPGNDWVAGVDGCPGGWLLVMRPLSAPQEATVAFVERFAEILALRPAARCIGVDMPIGLPERSGIGGRKADVEARANLGKRQSSIFAVPSRAAVMQDDYARSCAVAYETSDPPRKVSKQCFHIFSKIREIDAVMTPVLQSLVHEVHPEVAFWALNGMRPLDEPKKVKSRPYEPGLELRRHLLETAGYDPGFLRDLSKFRRSIVGPDDLLDAAVCSWTAARIPCGDGRRFPAAPATDAKGLRMEIWG